MNKKKRKKRKILQKQRKEKRKKKNFKDFQKLIVPISKEEFKFQSQKSKKKTREILQRKKKAFYKYKIDYFGETKKKREKKNSRFQKIE